MARGRKSTYKPEYAQIAQIASKHGLTDVELAKELKVQPSTLYKWQRQYPEFAEALKLGKDNPDDRVEKSLYHRAIGYSYDAVKIMQYQGQPVVVPYTEHVPPDTTAAIFWLKNRRREEWRDRHENVNVNLDARSIVVELRNRIGADKAQELLEAVAPNLLAQMPVTLEGEAKEA